MNVRLEIDFNFLASVYIEDKIFNNKYYIKIELLTNTMDHYEQNTALDRIRHMLYKEFSNAIFFDQDEDEDIAKKFSDLGAKTITIPGPPVDQLLGLMLFCKLNAVMEERLFITHLKIASDLGDKLYYCQDSEEDVGPFEFEGWWHDKGNNTQEQQSVNNTGNVIEFSKKQKGWHNYGLEWNMSDNIDNNIELIND